MRLCQLASESPQKRRRPCARKYYIGEATLLLQQTMRVYILTYICACRSGSGSDLIIMKGWVCRFSVHLDSAVDVCPQCHIKPAKNDNIIVGGSSFL